MAKKDSILSLLKLHCAFALLVSLLLPTNVQGQNPTSPFECARVDTFDVHPISTAEGLSSFIILLNGAEKHGLKASEIALQKAFKIASEANLRKERATIAYHLLQSISRDENDISKQITLATLILTDLDLLPKIRQSSALNVVAGAFASAGDQITALSYYQRAYELADSTRLTDKLYPLGNLSVSYLSNHDTATALEITHRLISLSKELDDREEVAYNHVYDYTLLGKIHLVQGCIDSAQFYVSTASQYSKIFTTEHRRHREIQITLLPTLIELNIVKNNLAQAREYIDILKKSWPNQSRILEAEYFMAIGQLKRALAFTKTPIKSELVLDKKRIQLRQKIASKLGEFKIATEASTELLVIAENNLTNSKRELVTISKAKMEAFEVERKADIVRYEDKLDILQTRLRNGIAAVLILLSLGVAIWFNQRYRKSQERSLTLSKIVTQHEKDLIVANEKLASKVKSMESFNHLLSHDLREPLRSISGFTSILTRKAKPHKELTEDFGMLSRSVEQLTYLMTGVEQLRRVEERTIMPTKVDLHEILADITKNVTTKYADHSVTINKKGAFDSVRVDKDLLHKSLLELVDNAVKFCVDNVAHITVEIVQQEGNLVIYVQDEGIGLNTEFGEQIFGIFKRLNRRETYVGSGVGLALAKLASEKCNGSISLLESQVGLGSTFQLTIPLSVAAASVLESEKSSTFSW